MTAALEAAECGKQIILAERTPTLAAALPCSTATFPRCATRFCGLEINLRASKGNRNVRTMTMTEVLAVSGRRGDYTVTLKARHATSTKVAPAAATAPSAVSAEIDKPLRVRPGKTGAAYLPARHAYPQRYVIDPSIVGTPEGEKAKAACKVRCR